MIRFIGVTNPCIAPQASENRGWVSIIINNINMHAPAPGSAGELGPPSRLLGVPQNGLQRGDSPGRRNLYSVGPSADCEVTSLGVGSGTQGRPEGRSGALTTGTGSGPEGSSLTVDSQRSWEPGWRRREEHPTVDKGVHPDVPGSPCF